MPVNDHESPFRVWRHLTTFISAVLFVLALADIPEQARKWRDGWIAVRGPLSGILDWITATLDGTAGRWILGVAALALMLLFSPLLDRPIEWVKKRGSTRITVGLGRLLAICRGVHRTNVAAVWYGRRSTRSKLSLRFDLDSESDISAYSLGTAGEVLSSNSSEWNCCAVFTDEAKWLVSFAIRPPRCDYLRDRGISAYRRTHVGAALSLPPTLSTT